MKKINIYFLFAGCCLSPSISVWAQNPVVSGTVTTTNSSEKLSNVTVTLKGTSRATVTNSTGQFKIWVNNLNSDTLVFSYVGSQPK